MKELTVLQQYLMLSLQSLYMNTVHLYNPQMKVRIIPESSEIVIKVFRVFTGSETTTLGCEVDGKEAPET